MELAKSRKTAITITNADTHILNIVCIRTRTRTHTQKFMDINELCGQTE